LGFLIFLLVVVGLGFLGWRKIASLDGDQKVAIKDGINNVFLRAEASGTIPAAPAFSQDYAKDYPGLSNLEQNFDVVRAECEALLGVKEKLTDIEALGGGYTEGGIHSAKWKSFMFKSGQFIDQNCQHAPQTTALLRQIPNLYTAFFSVLDPHQYITPHFGYYKGFMRYHLGIIIPDDNAENKCWLRVNADLKDNAKRDKELVDRGEFYYWHEGEGVIFDDTFLHDAENASDRVRVVLWLDIARKMPWHLHVFNKIALWVVHKEGSVRRIRKNATLDF